MYHYISLADIMPNLLIILVASNAYMRGRMSGLILGLFGGLLVDVTAGNSVLGLYALIYMLIGYIIGFTNKYYSNDDYTLPILIIAFSDMAYGFLVYISEFLLRGRLNFLFYFRRLILPEIIYTVAVSVFLYKLLHVINNRLEYKPDKEV
jgi:rod shape-determining protein MreD